MAERISDEATVDALINSSRHQLTCRRVKDCCAQLHNSIQLWFALNSKSFDILNKLVNILTEQKYMYIKENSFGEMTEVKNRLEGKMIEKSEILYLELQSIMSEMDMIVEKFGIIMKNLRNLVELLTLQGVEEIPLFHTLLISTYAQYASEIHQAYCEEQNLHQATFDDLFQQKNKDTMTLYLSCWLHEPCINTSLNIKLEALLIDTGLKE